MTLFFYNLCEQHGIEAAGMAAAHTNTVQHARHDYDLRIFSALDIAELTEPTNLRVLCCHRVGPPPEFVALPTRTVTWCPVPIRVEGEMQHINDWRQEWLCHGCNSIIPFETVVLQGRRNGLACMREL